MLLPPRSFVRDWQLKTGWYHQTKKCYPRAKKILAEKISAGTFIELQGQLRRSTGDFSQL
jgi:hypothetical protein